MSGFPEQPGWRAAAHGETSKQAALAVRDKAPSMIARVRALLLEGPASPEQLHAKLVSQGTRCLLTSVRARVCQLHKLGEVLDSGARSIGESGTAKVIVWRLATEEERAAFEAAKAEAENV